jgi:hypothetical protein
VLDAVQRVITGGPGAGRRAGRGHPGIATGGRFSPPEFPRQLVDYLLITYLQRFHPQLAFALRALGVIRAVYVAAHRQPSGAHTRYVVDITELATTLRQPELVLRNAFGWGTADFDYPEFASQVDNLLMTIGVDTSIEPVSPSVAARSSGPEPPGRSPLSPAPDWPRPRRSRRWSSSASARTFR